MTLPRPFPVDVNRRSHLRQKNSTHLKFIIKKDETNREFLAHIDVDKLGG